MYICLDCGKIFDEPTTYTEDMTPGGVFEGDSFIQHYTGCPNCEGAYEEAKECDNCTEIIAYSNGEYTKQGFWCNKCLEELEEEL